MSKCPFMTTNAGNPVADNQNRLTAGSRSPALMANHQLMERMAHFNRERVPERVVHAKGADAYGTLTGKISDVIPELNYSQKSVTNVKCFYVFQQ